MKTRIIIVFHVEYSFYNKTAAWLALCAIVKQQLL